MRHDAAFFLQNEGVEMTPEQVTQLRQVCSDNAATVQSLTDASIEVARDAWDAHCETAGIGEPTKTLQRPGYPDLPTLLASIENETDEVKFAVYVYNGLDAQAATLGDSLLSASAGSINSDDIGGLR